MFTVEDIGQTHRCHLDPRMGNELLLSDVRDDRSSAGGARLYNNQWKHAHARPRQCCRVPRRKADPWRRLLGCSKRGGPRPWLPGSTSPKPRASSRWCWLDTAPAGRRCAATRLKSRIHESWEWYSLPAQFAPRRRPTDSDQLAEAKRLMAAGEGDALIRDPKRSFPSYISAATFLDIANSPPEYQRLFRRADTDTESRHYAHQLSTARVFRHEGRCRK